MISFIDNRRIRFERLKLNRELLKKQSSVKDKGQNNKNATGNRPEQYVETVECSSCKGSVLKEELKNNYYVCPCCGHYFTISPNRRIKYVMDERSFKPFKYSIPDMDPLNFPGYIGKKEIQRQKTHYEEAVLSGVGSIEGRKAVIAVMNSAFLMGSMGIYVGEVVTRAVEYANRRKLPLIIFCASGGARMQEGMLSLLQMAKTSAALRQFNKSGGLYIAYLTHPTTGGVAASFAGLGDITLAEPDALIGFAGPKVIEQTIGQKLPDGFQRSEYLLEHGFVDRITERKDMRKVLGTLLMLHDRNGRKDK